MIDEYKLFLRDLYAQNFHVYEDLFKKLDEKEQAGLLKVIKDSISFFRNVGHTNHLNLPFNILTYLLDHFYFNPEANKLDVYKDLAVQYGKTVKEIMDIKDEAIQIFRSIYAQQLTAKLNDLRKKKSRKVKLYKSKEVAALLASDPLDSLKI